MNFIKFAVSLLCFGYLFWYVLMIIISLPSWGLAPIVIWVSENNRSLMKRFFYIPVLLLALFLGTFLPAGFYSAGIFAITSYFMQQASYPWLYIIIGGLVCFSFSAPSGETNLLGMLSSLGCYILFMTIMEPIGEQISNIGDSIIGWTIGIMLIFLAVGLLIVFVVWLFKKVTENPPSLSLGDIDNTSGYGKASILPITLKKWNWGAFFLTWLWGLFNGTYISLLYFIPVPIVQTIIPFILGAKGNKWAWQNKRWQDEEHFKRIQRRWAIAGFIFLILMIVSIVLSILYGDWGLTEQY